MVKCKGKVWWPGLAPALRALPSHPPLSSFWFCWPGVARRQLTFLLLRQKKSKQKKRRPWCLRPFASLRATCGARSSRGLAKLAALRFAQTTPALIRLDLRSSAHTQGVGEKYQYLKPQGHALACPCLYLSWFLCLLSPFPIAPSWLGRGAQRQADQGRRCLSEASLAGPRLARAPQIARSEA